MPTLLHPYAILSSVSALITFLASIIAWRRPAPGSSALALLLLSMAVWSGGYTPQWMDLGVQTKVFWFKVMFLGVASLPMLFLLFALGFTNNHSWLTRRRLIFLALPTLVSLSLQWTNDYHHWMYRSLEVLQENDLLLIHFTRGPWYLANVTYSYLLIGIGIFLMQQGAMQSGPLYRHQLRLVLIATLLPWGANVLYESNIVAGPRLDVVPLTFGLSGIVFAVAVLRTHFMDLIPVARSYLIETMRDGVLVLDAKNRIVDINPAMENFVGGKASSYVGKDVFDVFGGWIETIDPFLDGREGSTEMQFPKNPSRYLDLQVSPLYDRGRLLSGRLMVFRDITERKQVERRLRYVNDRLQSQLIEIGLLQSKLREQAIRDSLTNLFNRRYLEETLDRELSRAAREGYPVCIIMIDLDHFKKVNDTHGHEAGDLVLKAIAELLGEHNRRGDIVCRYGGEEFVIAMPNMTVESAHRRAETLRQSLTLLSVPYGYNSISVTISMGIACYPEHGDTRVSILRAADQAMYAAKDAGRDHILSYNELQLTENALED